MSQSPTECRRVLIVAPAKSIHTVRWANALAAEGWAVEVATCSNHLPSAHDAYLSGIVVHALPFRAPFGYFLNGLRLRNIVSAGRFNVVHAHYASGYGTLLSFVNHPVTFLSVWGMDVYEFPYRSAFNRWLLGRNLRTAGELFSTSLSMAAHTRALFPDLREIPVVPFGVDVEKFRRIAPSTEPTPNYPIAPAAPVATRPLRVGLCKALEPKYGVDLLLRAFAEATRHGTTQDAELQIVGEGSARQALEELARTLGIDSRTRFLGRIPNAEVPAFLSSLDVFCALSIDDSESFGVAVVEAMSCELAVVVSDVSGFKEVVGDASCGVIVPRGDAAAAAAALRRLLADPAERARLGAAARARVLSHYSWRENVRDLVRHYLVALARRHAGRGKVERKALT